MLYFKYILVFLLSIVLMLVLGELYYRFWNPAVLGNTGSLSYQKWSNKNVKLNQFGFRDQERNHQKASPAVHRALFLGPSNVYGQAVTKLEDRITERLEKLLNTEYRSHLPDKGYFEVMNAGTMTLDNIGSSVLILQQFIQSHVALDSVVLYYTWNSIRHIDSISTAYNKQKQSHYKELQGSKNSLNQFLSQHSYLYDWIVHVTRDKAFKIDGKTYNEWHLDYYRNPLYFDEHIAALKQLKALSEKAGAQFYLLLTPVSYSPEEREKYNDIKDHLIQEAAKAGIDIADATHIYDGIRESDIPVSKYDGHNKSVFYGDMAQILANTMNFSKENPAQ
jgi:hypothetical protein